ncbi:MAG: Smr/MutS family protein [Proteobacteria bacterium]|nr:Smr/MutS family protein [Pseudomonadota bacterium]
MKRQLRPDEVKVWAVVARTVRPAPGRVLPHLPPEPELVPSKASLPSPSPSGPKLARPRPITTAPEDIEPGRKRRIARARDPIEARLDLHGLDQDRARAALHNFLHRAHADGLRAVLVITGKGVEGDGILKRRTPDWLSEPAVRPLIAGVSPAERRHGGEGALYIALKRRK